MSDEHKPSLGFGVQDRAVALLAPIEATEQHRPHRLDAFVIELGQDDDTAVIYVSEVDSASGSILDTRTSMKFPISMLADLVRRRSMTAKEQEEFARAK